MKTVHLFGLRSYVQQSPWDTSLHVDFGPDVVHLSIGTKNEGWSVWRAGPHFLVSCPWAAVQVDLDWPDVLFPSRIY